ncbi:uncharacterized protein METZ01_LOCUS398157, partial [marine metagenome]
MNAITNLCDRVIWLDNGSIVDILPAKEAVKNYLMSSYSSQTSHIQFKMDEEKPAQGISMQLMNNDGESSNQFLFEDDINVKFDYLIRKKIRDGHLYCQLFNSDGSHLMVSYDFDHPESNCSLDVGKHCVKFKIPGGILSPSMYYINMRINSSLMGKLDLSDSEDEKMCSFIV